MKERHIVMSREIPPGETSLRVVWRSQERAVWSHGCEMDEGGVASFATVASALPDAESAAAREAEAFIARGLRAGFEVALDTTTDAA